MYKRQVRAIGWEAWSCRADHAAAEDFAKLIPEDGIIMTHDPNMFQIMGKNAAQISLFTQNQQYAATAIQPVYKDKIYLHWSYWCNTQDPLQVAYCRNMLDEYDTVLVAERIVRDQHFGLYRVLGERSVPARAGNTRPSTKNIP